LILKSISVTFNSLDLGLLFGEQGLTIPEVFRTDQIFRTTGIRQNHSHSLVASFKLARRVSLGVNTSYLVQSTQADPSSAVTGFSINYGILLQPESNLRIGVFYANLPDTLSTYRRNLDRIADESVNIGASYAPFQGTSLALDLRNLGEEGGFAIREFHAGFEQVILSHLALRAGYFHDDDGHDSISVGVGLFDGNSLFRPEKRFDHRNFLLNYALVYEKAPMAQTRTHFLTFLLRV